MDINAYLNSIGSAAKAASRITAQASGAVKNQALSNAARGVRSNREKILEANRADLDAARNGGMPETKLDRLALDSRRLDGICEALEGIIALPDPAGRSDASWRQPNGLYISRVRVPLGVVVVMYESRPNVTADAAALCIKSGNAVILRGGSEAVRTNLTISEVFRKAAGDAGLPQDAVQCVGDTSRETAAGLMRLREYADVLIPRGGAGLIKAVVENATVPVIETGVGNCHVYVDASADLAMAEDILYNAKISRPSVCNAVESLIVHASAAAEFLPAAQKRLSEKNVELRCCEISAKFMPGALPASEEDYYAEYNDYILSVKVVTSLGEAISHINKYSSGHSEAIITRDYPSAERFVREVDSAAVYVNASTRFTDGGEFGLGAEIGISTQKLHARGPMGLEQLTSVKYIIRGDGQVRL